ncbi:uncharacterized protein LOC108022353 [Drosophila biarmipes]|uniref:uncharacterized protein LOC108022353 n=1 Tax=Drosophila biarmipes TaxID=125945 RepID=UPI0007E818CA|nr:uncharacterized protein LOC108022353 [Drosophila biarmipes]
MSEEEAPAEGGVESPGAGSPAEAAAPPPDTTTAEPVDTTTSGARMMMTHPWLAAAAVAVYATKVLWVKFRELGLAKQKTRLKNQNKKSKPLRDIEGNSSESESEAETDAEDEGAPDMQNAQGVNLQLVTPLNLVNPTPSSWEKSFN